MKRTKTKTPRNLTVSMYGMEGHLALKESGQLQFPKSGPANLWIRCQTRWAASCQLAFESTHPQVWDPMNILYTVHSKVPGPKILEVRERFAAWGEWSRRLPRTSARLINTPHLFLR